MKRVALLLAVAMVGCASPEQLAKMDDAECLSMGAQPGTDSYLQCRIYLSQRRTQQNQAVGRAIAEGMRAQSDAYNRSAAQAPRPMTCTHRPSPGGVTTTCY